jgi:hypothetical protein
MSDLIIPNKLAQFEQVRGQISQLAQKCSNYVVNSKDALAGAKELAKDAKKIENLIEDRRKEITKPILDEKKQIDDFAKSLTSELASSIKGLRDQILHFEKEEERKRQEELRKIAEENARIAAELAKKEAEMKAKQEADSLPSIEEAEAIMQARQAQAENEAKQAEIEMSKSSNIRKVWTYKILDLEQVPLQFMIVNEKAVKAAIANGTREIKGLEIYQEEQLVIR